MSREIVFIELESAFFFLSLSLSFKLVMISFYIRDLERAAAHAPRLFRHKSLKRRCFAAVARLFLTSNW